MEYANLHSHHHQLQEQVNIGVQSASTPIIAPSTLVTTTSNYHSWNPSLILSNGSDVYPTETNIPNSRPFWHSPTTTFTSHNQDFTYGDHARSSAAFTRRSAAIESPLSNIKEEPNPGSFSKLKIANIMGLMSNSSYSAPEFCSNVASFGHGFPSTNASRSISTTSGSLFQSLVLSSGGFNNIDSHEALDLLSSTASYSDHGSQSYSSHSSSQHSNNNNTSGLYRDLIRSMGQGRQDIMHDQSRSSPSNTFNNNMTSAFHKEVTTRTKRPSSVSEPKKSHADASKKCKSTLRSSNPPLKVRKEKLGDRIAALHRLVAPFGKTDTASVLTEAIGYIQFLHDQVQTLSMPYMKSNSLQSMPSRKMQQVHGLSKEEETELKNLRNRGLCLVPLSCASYLNGFD